MASDAELLRLRQLIADDAAVEAALDAAGVAHCDTSAYRISRGKRILDAHQFMQHRDAPFLLLSFAIASVP